MQVQAEVRDHVGWVTIARPEKRNALTAAMWGAIPDVLASLTSRDDVAVVALQGAGGNFGAGADLTDVLAATVGRAEATAYCTLVVRAIVGVATCRLPTVALVAGVAVGGAAELAVAADLRFVDATASFAFPFARVGVVPDRFTLDRLVRLVGPSRARGIVFTGDAVDAARACDLGLADELTPEGGLADAMAALAGKLTRGGTGARSGMKRVLALSEVTDVEALVAPMVDAFVAGEVAAAARRFLGRQP